MEYSLQSECIDQSMRKYSQTRTNNITLLNSANYEHNPIIPCETLEQEQHCEYESNSTFNIMLMTLIWNIPQEDHHVYVESYARYSHIRRKVVHELTIISKCIHKGVVKHVLSKVVVDPVLLGLTFSNQRL